MYKTHGEIGALNLHLIEHLDISGTLGFPMKYKFRGLICFTDLIKCLNWLPSSNNLKRHSAPWEIIDGKIENI